MLFSLTSCATMKKYKAYRTRKKAEKVLIMAEKQNQKDYVRLKKSHYQMQPDNTQKMMKATRKKNKKLMKPMKRKRY